MKQHRVCPWTGSKEHYKSSACIVWCFDRRFINALKALVRHREYKDCDTVLVAGGAKTIASPKTEHQRDVVLDQIETSIELHHASKVILMNHTDCGAYKGAPDEVIKDELLLAKAYLEEHLSKPVPIEMIFVDFEGVWSLE